MSDKECIESLKENEVTAFKKGLAVLCQIGIFVIVVPLFVLKLTDSVKDGFLHHHAKQAFLSQVVMVVSSILILIAEVLLSLLMYSGGRAGAETAVIFGIALVGAWFACMAVYIVCICIACFRAVQGRAYSYPGLSVF